MDNHSTVTVSDQPSLLELQNLRLFEGIDLSSIYSLLESCPIHYLRPREALLEPNDSNDCLYLILAGECAIHLNSPDEEAIAVYGAGESVGELSMIDDQPVSAYVIATTPCRLMALNRRTFWTLAAREDGFARNLLITLANRLRDTNRAIAKQGSRRVQPEHDTLTGLPTRGWFQRALERQIDHCLITQRTFSILVVEILDFAQLVDDYGDQAGEEALRCMGAILKEVLRPTDRPAWCEGGRFIALLPHTEPEAARIAAERVREAVAGTVLTLPDDSILPSISVDYGAAGFTPGCTPDSLTDSARGDLTRRRARLGKRYR